MYVCITAEAHKALYSIEYPHSYMHTHTYTERERESRLHIIDSENCKGGCSILSSTAAYKQASKQVSRAMPCHAMPCLVPEVNNAFLYPDIPKGARSPKNAKASALLQVKDKIEGVWVWLEDRPTETPMQ